MPMKQKVKLVLKSDTYPSSKDEVKDNFARQEQFIRNRETNISKLYLKAQDDIIQIFQLRKEGRKFKKRIDELIKHSADDYMDQEDGSECKIQLPSKYFNSILKQFKNVNDRSEFQHTFDPQKDDKLLMEKLNSVVNTMDKLVAKLNKHEKIMEGRWTILQNRVRVIRDPAYKSIARIRLVIQGCEDMLSNLSKCGFFDPSLKGHDNEAMMKMSAFNDIRNKMFMEMANFFDVASSNLLSGEKGEFNHYNDYYLSHQLDSDAAEGAGIKQLNRTYMNHFINFVYAENCRINSVYKSIVNKVYNFLLENQRDLGTREQIKVGLIVNNIMNRALYKVSTSSSTNISSKQSEDVIRHGGKDGIGGSIKYPTSQLSRDLNYDRPNKLGLMAYNEVYRPSIITSNTENETIGKQEKVRGPQNLLTDIPSFTRRVADQREISRLPVQRHFSRTRQQRIQGPTTSLFGINLAPLLDRYLSNLDRELNISKTNISKQNKQHLSSTSTFVGKSIDTAATIEESDKSVTTLPSNTTQDFIKFVPYSNYSLQASLSLFDQKQISQFTTKVNQNQHPNSDKDFPVGTNSDLVSRLNHMIKMNGNYTIDNVVETVKGCISTLFNWRNPLIQNYIREQFNDNSMTKRVSLLRRLCCKYRHDHENAIVEKHLMLIAQLESLDRVMSFMTQVHQNLNEVLKFLAAKDEQNNCFQRYRTDIGDLIFFGLEEFELMSTLKSRRPDLLFSIAKLLRTKSVT
ncbi:hypothetical protein GJ496_006869 [Pomphorhynchus laevis]|nr:hypothetical protein GJ496_006869 [Pomphorhynchus laevis]